MKRGDVIVGIDGKTVDNPFQLKNMVASTRPGKTVDLKIVRDGNIMVLPLTLTELSTEAAAVPAVEINNSLKGVTVQDLNADILKQLGIKREIQGVVILNVEEDSRALGLLKRGDIIMEINKTPIHSAAEFRNSAAKITQNDSILLLIMQGGFVQYLTLAGQ